jgi:hypothetical protein
MFNDMIVFLNGEAHFHKEKHCQTEHSPPRHGDTGEDSSGARLSAAAAIANAARSRNFPAVLHSDLLRLSTAALRFMGRASLSTKTTRDQAANF